MSTRKQTVRQSDNQTGKPSPRSKAALEKASAADHSAHSIGIHSALTFLSQNPAMPKIY